MLDREVGVGHGLVGAFWLLVWGWTVSHLLARVGVSLGLGACCCSDCCLSCSLGFGFGCCCSWRFCGSPPCVAQACSVASGPPPSCLAFSSPRFFLNCWVGAASPALALTCTFAVMLLMPAPHITMFFGRSSHLVSLSSSHSVMPCHCISSRTACAAVILAIL